MEVVGAIVAVGKGALSEMVSVCVGGGLKFLACVFGLV